MFYFKCYSTENQTINHHIQPRETNRKYFFKKINSRYVANPHSTLCLPRSVGKIANHKSHEIRAHFDRRGKVVNAQASVVVALLANLLRVEECNLVRFSYE